MCRVTVVVSVLNEERTILDLLNGLATQTLLPEEVIVADGGSCDATRTLIEKCSPSLPFPVRILNVPGNIARGRNAGVGAAATDIVAITDAGCVPQPDWLAEITYPIEYLGAQAVAGSYSAFAKTPLERAIATFTWVALRDDSKTYLPSHRSVAYRRLLWKEIGGYDERLAFAEDTFFDLQVVARGGFVLAPRASVAWAPRNSTKGAIRQQFSYGFGDGQAQIQVAYHLTMAAFVLFEACVLFGSVPFRTMGIIAYLATLFYFVTKYTRLFGATAVGYLLVAEMLLVLPIARLAGFISGTLRRAA